MLQLIAVTSMLLDHVGYLLDSDFLRIIGRVAFPIYCFLIVQSFRRVVATDKCNRWLFSLFLLAFISQPFYMLVFDTWRLNILFQFFFFFLFLALLFNQRWYSIIVQLLILFSSFYLSQVGLIGYGVYGFAVLTGFFLFHGIWSVIIYIVITLTLGFLSFGTLQVFSIFIAPFLLFFNRQYVLPYWFWHYFYPAHLVVLTGWLISF